MKRASLCTTALGMFGLVLAASAAAQTALTIDPQSAAALSILGWVRVMIDQDCERGLDDLDGV